MTTHIALLRAVNLAGHNRIGMEQLRALLDDLGLEGARTLLQSGNAVFRSRSLAPAALERLLEQTAADRLGLRTDFLIRTAGEWQKVVSDNPFPGEAKEDPGHLLVMFLKQAPRPDQVAALRRSIRGREVVQARGRHLYVVYPDGIGRSRLTNAMIEKALGTRGTGRNWNTVLKLEALAAAL